MSSTSNSSSSTTKNQEEKDTQKDNLIPPNLQFTNIYIQNEDNPLWLPPLDSEGERSFCLQEPLHEYISSHPILSRNARIALGGELNQRHLPYHWKQDASVPVIYIHQREMAHVSSQQYDQRGAWLVSDSATTCHIVAFRSVFVCDKNKKHGSSQQYASNASIHENKNRTGNGIGDDGNVLGTLCHFDSAESLCCLEDIVQHHVDYHQLVYLDHARSKRNTTSNTTRSTSTTMCQLDIHVIGGYNDSEHTSNEIMHALFSSLTKLATRWKDCLRMTLQTCIVCGLNSHMHQDSISTFSDMSFFSSPVVRGLAMNVASGEIHVLQKIHPSLLGPEPILRHARLWSTAPETKEMLLIHDWDKDRIVIRPFRFCAFDGIETLVRLPDPVLLQYTSTSPECEDDDFCDNVRKVCQFLMDVRSENVFGPIGQEKSLEFEYDGIERVWTAKV